MVLLEDMGSGAADVDMRGLGKRNVGESNVCNCTDHHLVPWITAFICRSRVERLNTEIEKLVQGKNGDNFASYSTTMAKYTSL